MTYAECERFNSIHLGCKTFTFIIYIFILCCITDILKSIVIMFKTMSTQFLLCVFFLSCSMALRGDDFALCKPLTLHLVILFIIDQLEEVVVMAFCYRTILK